MRARLHFPEHDEIREVPEKMNIDAYLKRINYSGSLEPTAETLRALQVAHLFAVPFENLSIHAGEPIVLNEDALFGKIVENRRGGFCYEANGLFASLLRALGFEVAMLSAGVATRDGGFGRDFDHMTLMSVSVIHFLNLYYSIRATNKCRERARFASSKTTVI
jgi:arylamine N-acetyltransferase